jgi:hypothetical protein
MASGVLQMAVGTRLEAHLGARLDVVSTVRAAAMSR